MLMASFLLAATAMSTTLDPVVRPASTVRSARAHYDAGSTGTRRTSTWQAPSSTPNGASLSRLSTLRDRSRAAVRNDGHAKSIIDHLVTNVIGTGITLRSKAEDTTLRKLINAKFEEWTEYSDVNGQLDWYGQQTQATRSLFEGGDAFVRIRMRLPEDGLPVPLQLEVLEAEFCPSTYNDYSRRIRAGVEYDLIGRRVAYYFYKSRPELDDMDLSQLVRVPAELVVHLYDPLRPGQIRGVPVLAQALIKLFHLDKMSDAALLRQELANMFAMFVTKPAQTSEPFLNPMTGVESEIAADDKPFIELNPGTVQELDPGDDVEFSEPPDPGSNYEPFVQSQLRGACVSAGVPYEVVTGDMKGLNDRVMRVVLHEFRRRMMALQYQVVGFQLCRKVHGAFMDRAFLSGALPIPADYLTNRRAYTSVEWAPHAWPYIHPVQDVDAAEKEIRLGLTSRSRKVAEAGDDAEEIDQEQADDNARADALGLHYDSDGRITKTAAAPTQATGVEGDTEGAPA